MKRKRKQPITPARAAMKPVCLFLGMVLILMLSGTIFIRWTLPNLPHLQTVPAMSNQSSPLLTASLPLTAEKRQTIHILLIGQDREAEEDVGRSDAMLLCSFDKESNTFYMTSFLRDLYLPIPGYGSDRLNAAYAYGGSELLCRTLSENFGITIDGWVEVDFARFSEVIDRLGGVELDLGEAEAQTINNALGSTLTEGLQHLTGLQALTYSRIRKLDIDGDFSRTLRHRKVLVALIHAYRDLDVPQLLSVLNALLPMVSTNLNPLSMLGYALEILPHVGSAALESRCIPAEGTYSDQTIDGMAVLVPDWPALKQLLAEYFPHG